MNDPQTPGTARTRRKLTGKDYLGLSLAVLALIVALIAACDFSNPATRPFWLTKLEEGAMPLVILSLSVSALLRATGRKSCETKEA